MKASQAELCYRRAAVQNATSAGLVVILYDLLIADLHAAMSAIRRNDVQTRTDHLKHALAILELLEGSLNRERARAAADILSQFYSHIRSQLLAAQFAVDEKLLDRQLSLIFDVRQAWREADNNAYNLGSAVDPDPAF